MKPSKEYGLRWKKSLTCDIIPAETQKNPMLNTKITHPHITLRIKQRLILSALMLSVFAVMLYSANFFGYAQTTGEISQNIDELTQQIKEKRSAIDELDKKISEYKANIRERQKQAKTLKNQIALLDDQLEATELEISKLKIRVNQTELEIQVNEKEIASLQENIATTKSQIAEFIRTIDKEDDKSYLEIILLYDNLSEFFNHLNLLSDVEEGLQQGLNHLEELVKKTQIEQKNLLTRKNNLVAIRRKLEEERAKLESNKITKNNLLAETRSSERTYQSLIAKERALQNRINNDIVTLEKTLRQKMAENKQLGDISKQGMIWPVPSRYITTYFHDPDYPFRQIFEHPAIDIRSKQGTPVRAAASGYVARARQAGVGGYSYIMIIHANGISTVYGHLSQLNVREDQYVVQGEVIARSGGMPGTPGAGRLTTGPHLHLEVRLNGIPVNPLNYLP